MTESATGITEFEKPSTTRSVFGACPLDCPDGCAWVIDLVDDQPVKIRPNKTHPFTRNTLCVKTNPCLSHVKNKNRLLYPQKRVGPKGRGQFERISWNEAFDSMAQNLERVIEQYGAEAIWPYAGSGTVGYIQGIVGSGKRLFHYLGASRHDPTICSIAGHVGMSYTSNSAAGMDPEDLVHSKLILLWGTNVIVTNRHLWPFIKQAQKHGAIVVTIDPIRTETAKHSDLHIALSPGTDGALALGLMQFLVERGKTDEEYLRANTSGWEMFRDSILPDFRLPRVAKICRLGEELLLNFANLVVKTSPIGIKTSMGLQRHAGGGQAARVLSCLPAVTGDYSKLGAGICYSTAPFYQLNTKKLCREDLQPRPTRSLAMTRLGQGLLELDDPPVQALLMWAANPMASNPDQNRVRAGLLREDLFTVVIENFQTDTADFADILLPSTMQIEHADLHDSYSHLYLQWNEPAVGPPGECLSHTEIFRRLAKHLGLTEPSLFDSDDDLARATLDSDHPALAGITLEQLKERGWMRLHWPSPTLPFKDGFPTDSGKFEFHSNRGERDGVGGLPHYVPPKEASHQNDDSLVLISSANKFLINSVFANSPLHLRAGDPTVVLNPKDAANLGLEPGERVQVSNERGNFAARLEVGDQIPSGVALSTKGQWPKRVGGNNVNATVEERDADMGRGAVFSDNRVFITAACEKPNKKLGESS